MCLKARGGRRQKSRSGDGNKRLGQIFGNVSYSPGGIRTLVNLNVLG